MNARESHGMRLTGLKRAACALAVVLTTVGVVGAGTPALAAAPDGQAVEGASFAGLTLATPYGCDAQQARPQIVWGDGATSLGNCSTDGISQTLRTNAHTFAEEGDYTGVAHYISPNGPRDTASFTVHAADAALNGTSSTIQATAGSSFSGVVASFTDADPGATAADYAAMISWGDGASSPGTVQASGSAFTVSATHTYSTAGSFAVSVSIADAGGASTTVSDSATVSPGTTTSSATTTATSSATTTTTTSAATGPTTAHASFTLPASVGAGQTVMFDASASRTNAGTIDTFKWTVNGLQLATCAGVTSQLMTRTLPVGPDSVGLTVINASGSSVSATQSIVGRSSGLAARAVAAGKRLHLVSLPAVATCLSGPSDPRGARVAPNRAYAPGPGCTTQVNSGILDAVGCLTEHQDMIVVTAGAQNNTHPAGQYVSLPPGQPGLDGVQNPADVQQLLQDVQNALNPAAPKICAGGAICSTVGEENLPLGAHFGAGGPVEGGGLARGAVAGSVGPAALARTARAFRGTDYFVYTACPRVAQVHVNGAGVVQCLDLWTTTGGDSPGSPVRVNGIDFAPADGGEIALAPQFNLVVSQSASTSLDGLLFNPTQPFQKVDDSLPAGGTTPGADYPALTVPDVPALIRSQPNPAGAADVIAALKSVGGFPSVDGLTITFDNDVATITFHVKLPAEFTGGSGNAPLTAAVSAQIGPTVPFHVVYGYLGNDSGGAGVNFGVLALNGFGVCYRVAPSSDAKVDPCPGITGIDDSPFQYPAWFASGEINIADLVKVGFRPGTNTVPGCAVPLGFAFSPEGGLAQAGASLTVTGGVPIFPGVFITGLAAGFITTPNYDKFAGCVGVQALDILQITGNLVSVKTVGGFRYTFGPDDLGQNVLQRTGGAFPYTTHLGVGASGVASLTLPEIGSFQVGDAYALYVDDPPAIFFGAGLDIGLPSGNYENPPSNGIAIKGGVKGAIGLRGGVPPPFDFEGYLNVTGRIAGENILSGGAEAILSYSPQPGRHGGLGVCVGLGAGAISGSAGFAYHWGDTYFDVLGDVNIGSCDNNWLDSQIGVNVQTARYRRLDPRANIATARVPSGLNAVNLHLHSATGAPDITVIGPDGARASTAGMPVNRTIAGPAFTLVRIPVLHETIVVPAHPRAGRYRITANPGSPPVTRIVRSDGVRPVIRAHVTGNGTHRRLHFSFTRRTGQRVVFFETSGQVHRSLGSSVGGHGSIPFTASAGHGRRQIVAEVSGNGVARIRISVAGYLAPSLVRLGPVRHVRVTHRGGHATVTFAAVAGAAQYQIYMKLSDGSRETTTTRAHRATFSPIFVDSRGTITVRALGDGLSTTTGPSTRAEVAPLFGRGRPVHRPTRPRHSRT